MKPKFTNIYFTGGSYTMIYQLGVGSYITKKYDINKINWYGCSAGALAVVMMFIFPPVEIVKYYIDVVNAMNKLIKQNPYDLSNYNLTKRHFEVFKIIHKKDRELYKKINGKVNIGVTTLDGFVWYNTFSSNKELFHILLNSFHVPILCTYNACINDKKCIDGGFGMDHCKHLPKNTFVVCPTTDAHAHLNGYIPDIYKVIPPSETQIHLFYNTGCKIYAIM